MVVSMQFRTLLFVEAGEDDGAGILGLGTLHGIPQGNGGEAQDGGFLGDGAAVGDGAYGVHAADGCNR